MRERETPYPQLFLELDAETLARLERVKRRKAAANPAPRRKSRRKSNPPDPRQLDLVDWINAQTVKA